MQKVWIRKFINFDPVQQTECLLRVKFWWVPGRQCGVSGVSRDLALEGLLLKSDIRFSFVLCSQVESR